MLESTGARFVLSEMPLHCLKNPTAACEQLQMYVCYIVFHI